jgi:hypothetical protein
MQVTLDGFDLDIDTQPGWSLQSGTAPHIRAFALVQETANSIFSGGSIAGSTLVFSAFDRLEPQTQQEVKRLTALGLAPTNLKGLAAITVVDDRWRWSRVHFTRAYNIRRRTGERRRVPGGPLAVQTIADDVAYAPWSLNPATSSAWTAEEMVKDVIGTVAGELGQTFRLADGVATALSGVPVENLEMDDAGDAAIARALAYLGGRIDVFLDWEGVIVVYDRVDGGERPIFGVAGSEGGGTKTRQDAGSGIGEPIVLTPNFAVQDRRRERPERIRFHFGTLPELRINFEESTQTGTIGPPANPADEATMDNAYRTVEDLTLPSRNSVQGEILPFPQALSAFNDPANGPKAIPTLPNLTTDLVRRRWLSPLLVAYAWTKTDQAGVWRRRVATIRGSYRLFFKVIKFWNDRIREYRNVLPSIEDIEGNAQAPAAVYADHALQQSVRWFQSKLAADDAEKHEIFRNVFAAGDAGPGNIIGTPIGDLVQAPASVGIDDQELGTVSIAYQTDFTGAALAVYRSAFEGETVPTDDNTKERVHTGLGDLSEDHQLSVLLSAVPAAPNDKRKYFVIEKTPEDLGGAVLGQSIGTAEGPPLDIRIPPSVHVARFAWPSNVGAPPNEETAWQAFAEGGDLIAQGYGDPTNLKQLDGIAEAQARSVYARFQDRVEGGLTTALVPNQDIVGNITGVSVEAGSGQDGGLLLVLTAAPEGPKIDFVSLLPPDVRRVVFRQVDVTP